MKSTKAFRLTRSGWHTLQWSCNTNHWNAHSFVPESEANKLITLVGKIQEKMPTLKVNAGVLIDKNSDIPRPKLKEYLNDNKLKKVTLLSKADVVVVRRESVKELLQWEIETLKIVPESTLKKILPNDDFGINKVYLQVQNGSYADVDYFNVESTCIDEKGWKLSGYRNKKQDEFIAFLESLIATKATLVYDDCLLNDLNKDGLDLDEDIYETLDGMLMSKDTDTFKLGIEMLSNINLENNLFKISMLMNKVHTRTNRFNAMSQFNNKNFKSLLAYLSANKIRWNQGWESFGMSMFAKFGKTEHGKFIKEYIVEQVNNRFKHACGNDVVRITDIVFE